MFDEASAPLRLEAITLRGLGPYLTGSRLEIRPLTLLCGKNGAGKSTWLKALNLLVRSREQGLLPFLFDREDSHVNHDEVNAWVKERETYPPRDIRADAEFGPLGTIGLHAVAARCHLWDAIPRPPSKEARLDSTLHAFLWDGRCTRDTRFRIRLAHPSRIDGSPELDELVELKIDDTFAIRMHKTPGVGSYRFTCAEAFLPGSAGDDTMLPVAELKIIPRGRISTVSAVAGTVDPGIAEPLCRAVVQRINDVLNAILDSFFYLGAIREPEARDHLGGKGEYSESEFEILVERLGKLAASDRPEEVERLVARIKNLGRPHNDHQGVDRHLRSRYVGPRGEATHRLMRDFAYNLMRQPTAPLTGHFDQRFKPSDFVWDIVYRIRGAAKEPTSSPYRRLWELSGEEPRRKLNDLSRGDSQESSRVDYDQANRECVADLFNSLLTRRDLYHPSVWKGHVRDEEARILLDRGVENLDEGDVVRLNRLLIEGLFPDQQDGICRRQVGYLFEVYCSYWLRKLVEVVIATDRGLGSLADAWDQGTGEPRGFLVHTTPRRQPIDVPWRGSGLDDSQSLERFIHPCFSERGFFAAPKLLSAGFHQVAPIVVQAGLLRPGELMAVENPEAHLHPSLQLNLTEYLIGEVVAGKWILIETHSDLVVRRVLRAILEEEVRQEAVRLYFTKLDGPDRQKFATLDPLAIDANGRVENWPEGFMDDAVRESRRLMEAMYGSTPPLEEGE